MSFNKQQYIVKILNLIDGVTNLQQDVRKNVSGGGEYFT